MHYDGSYAHIQASSGIDQGCPLSPCGFAAAVEPISRAILSDTRSRLDSGAKLWAYLDDWYIWIEPRHITEAIELISTATRTINLELQPNKIQIWTATCNSPIPPAFQDKAKSTLKCLGAHLRIAGDSEGSPVDLGGRPSMQTAAQRFQSISATLRQLNQAGLKVQTVNDLLTMYDGAASQHALRTTFVHARKPSTSTKRSSPTGHNLQAKTSPLRSFTSRYVWVGSGWAPRCKRHGQPGDPSSQLSWKPLTPRTSTPCSPPHPFYGANSTNYKSRYHNKWTNPHSFSNHWVWHSVHTGPKRLWSTRYNK